MNDSKKAKILKALKEDSNEYLLDRYVWYCKNFKPVDDEFVEAYNMVKAEVLNRMNKHKK